VSDAAGRTPAEDLAALTRASGAHGDGGGEEPPPILGRWSRLYLLIVLELALVIAALWWLTRRFA
jgi:hypothetical protein